MQQLNWAGLLKAELTPKRQKMRDSEPRPGKSNDKWVKGREMSQMSYWKDFQWRLWVLEVTYHFEAGAVNLTSHLRVIGFVISCFLAAILRETASQLVAAASGGRLEECNQTRSLNVFFGLSWRSIDI